MIRIVIFIIIIFLLLQPSATKLIVKKVLSGLFW